MRLRRPGPIPGLSAREWLDGPVVAIIALMSGETELARDAPVAACPGSSRPVRRPCRPDAAVAPIMIGRIRLLHGLLGRSILYHCWIIVPLLDWDDSDGPCRLNAVLLPEHDSKPGKLDLAAMLS